MNWLQHFIHWLHMKIAKLDFDTSFHPMPGVHIGVCIDHEEPAEIQTMQANVFNSEGDLLESHEVQKLIYREK